MPHKRPLAQGEHPLRRDDAWFCTDACQREFAAIAVKFRLPNDKKVASPTRTHPHTCNEIIFGRSQAIGVNLLLILMPTPFGVHTHSKDCRTHAIE